MDMLGTEKFSTSIYQDMKYVFFDKKLNRLVIEMARYQLTIKLVNFEYYLVGFY